MSRERIKIINKEKILRPNVIAAFLVPTLAAAIFSISASAESRGTCTGKPVRDGLSGAAACATKDGVDVYMPDGEVVKLHTISKPKMVTRILANRYIQFLESHEGGYDMREYDRVTKEYRYLNIMGITK